MMGQIEVFKTALARNFKSTWQFLAFLSFSVIFVVGAIIAVIFQDNITRYRLNPRTPYQLYTPPPAPSYETRGAWVLWPDEPKRGIADIFYIHSTTYASNQHWNAPLHDGPSEDLIRRVAAPNQAGPFLQVGAVYGPRYRQATLFANFTHKFDGIAALELAHTDIIAAFEQFRRNRQVDRPFIIVGYGAGGLHALGVLQNTIATTPSLRRYLAAAYVIGYSTPSQLFEGPLHSIPPCEIASRIGCVISYIDLESGFDADRKRFQQRALIWSEEGHLLSLAKAPLLCINPLSWTVSNALAPAALNLGAASATGLGMSEKPPAIANATSAQCVDGILKVTSPRQAFLRRKHWFGDHWRPQDFNLFYNDLTADATRRVSLLNKQLSQSTLTPAQRVDPNAETANKVPE